MGSIVVNTVRISEVIGCCFKQVQALRGNQVQDHGGFCKEVHVCVCFGNFEESPIPSQ